MTAVKHCVNLLKIYDQTGHKRSERGSRKGINDRALAARGFSLFGAMMSSQFAGESRKVQLSQPRRLPPGFGTGQSILSPAPAGLFLAGPPSTAMEDEDV